MTDVGVAGVIHAMAGAQKLMVPRWLYEAMKVHLGHSPAVKVEELHYQGGNIPFQLSEFLSDDVMVVMERNGGLKAVRLERTHATAEGKE